MQQLIFEPAWERTISDKDRNSIIEWFCKMDHKAGSGIKSTYLRHAINHRGNLLYTVLLHNYTGETYSLNNAPAAISDHSGNQVTESFTLPVNIPAYTSMPWTFIFPETANIVDAPNANLVFL